MISTMNLKKLNPLRRYRAHVTRVALLTVPLLIVLGLAFVPAGAVAAGPDGGTDLSLPSIEFDQPGDPDGSLAVRSVETRPAEPYPEQRVRFVVTLENDGRVPVELQSVRVLPREQPRYTPAEAYASLDGDLRTVDPGETVTVRIDQEDGDRLLNDSGIARLRANVTGETRAPSARDNVTVRDSSLFTVDVRDQPDPPRMEIAAQNLSVDQGRIVVTVVNPAEVTVENVQVKLSGDLPVEENTKYLTDVAGGQSKQVVFEVSPESAGEATVRARMQFEFVDGRVGSESAQTTVTVEGDGSGAGAEVVVTEPEATVGEDGSVAVTARLFNSGDSPASGVQVRVADTDRHSPSEWTAIDGGLGPDESVSFDRQTAVADGADTVTLEVQYRDEESGETVTETFDVDLPDRSQAAASDDGGGGSDGGLAATLLAVVVIAGVLALVVYGWRNRSGDDDGGAPVSPSFPGGVGTERIAGAADGLASAARNASLPGGTASDGGTTTDQPGTQTPPDDTQPPADPTPQAGAGASPGADAGTAPGTRDDTRRQSTGGGRPAGGAEARGGPPARNTGPVERQPGPDSRGGPGIGRSGSPRRDRSRTARDSRRQPHEEPPRREGRAPPRREEGLPRDPGNTRDRAPRDERRDGRDRRPRRDTRDAPPRNRRDRGPGERRDADRRRPAGDRAPRDRRDRRDPPPRDGRPAERRDQDRPPRDDAPPRRARDGRPRDAERSGRRDPRDPPRDRHGDERRSRTPRDGPTERRREREEPTTRREPEPEPDPEPTGTCSGCGETYPESELGTIDLADTDAATCQECQLRAVAAARERLGAEDDQATGMDELVTEMSDRPTCDGCGDPTVATDLKEVTLPDGSTALSCPDCRSAALSAARHQLTRQERN